MKDGMTIEIGAKLTVDKNTAEGCLKLVEIYVNQTGADVLCDRKEDGTLNFRFEEGR